VVEAAAPSRAGPRAAYLIEARVEEARVLVQQVRAWRVFKRMQWSAVAFGLLVYAAVALHGWQALELPDAHKRLVMVLFPAAYAALCLVVPLAAPPLRRPLKRYVWLSFAAGFGQSARSVLIALGVLAAAAGLIFFQIQGVEAGGRAPSGIFSAYGAGLGVLIAQAVLCLALEREPKIRALIER